MWCAAFLECVRNKHDPFHADTDFEVFPRQLHARHRYIVSDGSVGENLRALALAFSLNVSNSFFSALRRRWRLQHQRPCVAKTSS